MTTEEVNRIIHLFGEAQKASMRAERRDMLKSVLFDLPRRSSLGWQALYEHEIDFLRELSEHLPPEEVGRRMRTVGSRPYYLQLFIVMCTYLGARQQRMLDLGLHEGDPFPEERWDDLTFLIDWWSRASRAYRSDGLLIPAQGGDSQPILDSDTIEQVRVLLAPASEEEFTRIRRAAATLELYCFVLHGEQRDGIFGHGPYTAKDGRVLFLKEFNDLQNDYLPWADTDAQNPFPAVAIAYECRDISVRCDMFGGLVTDPFEFGDRLERIAVLACSQGDIRRLDTDEIEAVREAAAQAQEELYLKAVAWTPRYRIEYGAYLFANHLRPFFDLAGFDAAVGERIMRACEETAARLVDRLLADEEIPSIWKHIGTTEGPLFWPAVGP